MKGEVALDIGEWQGTKRKFYLCGQLSYLWANHTEVKNSKTLLFSFFFPDIISITRRRMPSTTIKPPRFGEAFPTTMHHRAWGIFSLSVAVIYSIQCTSVEWILRTTGAHGQPWQPLDLSFDVNRQQGNSSDLRMRPYLSHTHGALTRAPKAKGFPYELMKRPRGHVSRSGGGVAGEAQSSGPRLTWWESLLCHSLAVCSWVMGTSVASSLK